MPGKLLTTSLLAAIATLASLAGATAAARADRPSAHGVLFARCAPGSVAARIGGRRVCLRAGQRCKKRYERQYRRHGFHCQAGRLRRIRKTPPPPPPPPGPPAGRITATVPVGHPLGPVAAGEGAVWVENRDATVSRIDPATNTVVATVQTSFALTGTSGWIAAGAGAVWISNFSGKSITRIDPATNRVAATIPVGPAPTGLTITPGAVWVANHHGRSLSRIDPVTNTVVATIPVGDQTAPIEGGPLDLAVVGGSVWFVALEASGFALERLDPATNTIGTKIQLPSPGLLGSDGASLMTAIVSSIYPVDTASNALWTPIALPEASMRLAVGLGASWSLAQAGLTRVDLTARQVTGHSSFAGSGGLAVGYGAVWAGRGDQKLLRIEP
jgi:YVTN family beta-propeller protein